MAEGLARMLGDCGADARVHLDGIANLMRPQSIDLSSARSFLGSSARLMANRREFAAFLERMKGTDLIVIISHVPSSFSRSLMPNVELLRRHMPDVPIVNYDLVYTPSLDSWSRLILKDEKTGLSAEDLRVFAKGKFGMERYDWYLIVSVGGYIPLPPGPQPYSLIGLDLDDGRLYPGNQDEFRVLVDFEQDRGKYPEFREVQLEALRLSGVKYEKLVGSYTRDEIRAIYRRSSVLMLAHAESFGLPICEVQACGSLVFAADPHWVTAHWLGNEYHTRRQPRLSSNFVIYENEPEALATQLRRAAETFSSEAVRETFLREQPQLFRGDRAELARFLEKVSRREIHSKLHQAHGSIGRRQGAS